MNTFKKLQDYKNKYHGRLKECHIARIKAEKDLGAKTREYSRL